MLRGDSPRLRPRLQPEMARRKPPEAHAGLGAARNPERLRQLRLQMPVVPGRDGGPAAPPVRAETGGQAVTADHLAVYADPAHALAHLKSEHREQARALGINLDRAVIDPLAAHRFLDDPRTFPAEEPA